MSSGSEQKSGAGRDRVSPLAVVVFAALATAAGVFSALAILGAGGERTPSAAVGESSAAKGNGIQKIIAHAEPQAVPDLSFADADGKLRRLSEWRGKVVLLNLWATWCAPCKTEMPSLDRLQGKLESDRFTVLAVSTDRTGPKEPAAFFIKEGITHLALYNDDTAEANVSMRAEGLPLTVILNEDGREVARLLGPADWDSPEAMAKIEKFLNRGRSG